MLWFPSNKSQSPTNGHKASRMSCSGLNPPLSLHSCSLPITLATRTLCPHMPGTLPPRVCLVGSPAWNLLWTSFLASFKYVLKYPLCDWVYPISISEATILLLQYAQFSWSLLFFSLFMTQNLPLSNILYVTYVYYLSFYCLPILLECNSLEVFCSMIYPNHLKKCVAHSRYLISICGLK